MNNRGSAVKGGIFNPNSKIVQTLLWIYTIEPPIYADLNSACREMNLDLLDDLGPYAIALFYILQGTESYRSDRK